MNIAASPLPSVGQGDGERRSWVGLFGRHGQNAPNPAMCSTDSSQELPRVDRASNVEARAFGFRSTFVVLSIISPGSAPESQPASLNLLTWLGARTRTLRLGTAVLVLPWHNPVLLAEQAATLDLLSRRPARFRRSARATATTSSPVSRCRWQEADEPLRRVDDGDHPGLYQRRAVDPSRRPPRNYDNVVVRRRARSAAPRRSGWAPGSERSVRQVARARL